MKKAATKFHPVHSVYDGIINTVHEGAFNLLSPSISKINIDDIALVLSNTCRFGGHVKTWYCNAQHSVFVSALCPTQLKRAGLIHDVAEVYLQDLMKPIKVLLAEVYETLYNTVEKVVLQKFGISPSEIELVKPFCKMATTLESKAMQEGKWDDFMAVSERLKLAPIALPAIASRELFLRHFNNLFPKYNQ